MENYTRRYYAALNTMNAQNAWDVLVFDSKKLRDSYVNKMNGSWTGNNIAKCRAINKKEVTRYATNLSLTQNKMLRPETYKGEYWGISYVRDGSIAGYVGDVVIAHENHSIDRLF